SSKSRSAAVFGLTEYAAPHDETFISAIRPKPLCPTSWAPTDFLTSERAIPNRSQDDVIVGRRSPTDSIEGFTLDVLVLGAERHAAIVSLGDVLPEAERQLGQALVVRDAVGGRGAAK